MNQRHDWMITLPETNSSNLPGKLPPKGNLFSNYPFSGAMLVSERVKSFVSHVFSKIIFFERSLRDLGRIVEAGNFGGICHFFAFVSICFLFLSPLTCESCGLVTKAVTSGISRLDCLSLTAAMRPASIDNNVVFSRFNADSMCWGMALYDNRLHPTNLPLLMSWRASKKFVVYLDLIQLLYNHQKLILLMEEIKLEIHDTEKPNFISNKKWERFWDSSPGTSHSLHWNHPRSQLLSTPWLCWASRLDLQIRSDMQIHMDELHTSYTVTYLSSFIL